MSTTTRLVAQLWAFLRIRKKWWLTPIVVTMLIIGLMLIFAQSSVLGAFIYTIF